MPARIPLSTYRLQLQGAFTFDQAAEQLDYLQRLGIGDCYLSPVLRARPGSLHGYDVIDHSRINPELGGEAALLELAQGLRRRGMGLVLDVVPNHMCITGGENAWWRDVLENGPSSPFADHFDIDWNPPKSDLAFKVLLPILGDQYGRILEAGELSVSEEAGAFRVRYWEHEFPLAPGSLALILVPVLQALSRVLGENHPQALELESIVASLGQLPTRVETDPPRVRRRLRERAVIRRRLSALLDECPEARRALAASLVDLNGRRGDPRSFDRLEELLADQPYRLCYWRVAADEINYRRFFDINELAAIRVEEPAVFEAVHEVVFGLVRLGVVTGLRIDHVDGLRDPEGYLRALQRACAPATAGPELDDRPLYIVVEKVLADRERLAPSWPVHGTSGYELMNLLCALFVEPGGARRLVTDFQRRRGSFSDTVYWCKKLVLRASLSSELTVLARRLDRISEQHRHTRDFTLDSLHRALLELIACLPMYRTYVRPGEDEVAPDDRRRVEQAVREAKQRNPVLSGSIFDFLRGLLLLEHPEELDEVQREYRRDFVLRLQQLTGPVMAKGVEDTAFYRWIPLSCLNEVGGEPDRPGVGKEAFQRACQERLERTPHALSATSTHDTKRGEDVRVRIAVLSELAEEWLEAVGRWRELNAPHRAPVDGYEAPVEEEELLLYQTLLGAWPWDGLESAPELPGRIAAYMEKASREAKLHTSWISPQVEHEEAVARFVALVLDPARSAAFLADFTRFQAQVAWAGVWTSLAQVVLKVAVPGVPDFYQGSELWDLALVDPDNRRPVDFARRRAGLESLEKALEQGPAAAPALIARLAREPADGLIKLFVTWRALALRAARRAVFERGEHVAVEVEGERAAQVIAFARRCEEGAVLAVTGRWFARCDRDHGPPAGELWRGTRLILPESLREVRFRDALAGHELSATLEDGHGHLPLEEVFRHLPVALLEGVE